MMKFFPEFAMMVQMWSGQNRYQSLHGWQRIAYAIRSLRYMRLMGANVSFMDCVRHLNGEFKITLKRSDTENGHVREMSYENFFQQYGKTIDLFSPKEKKPEQSKQSSKLAIAKFFGIGKEDKDDNDGSDNEQGGDDDDSLSSMVIEEDGDGGNQNRMDPLFMRSES